ncbi:MAG: hypothetical protein MZV63_22695 [Marinilabiliales bacterium]|nr:hypothetical protein [Marinilabiliales bacterium]
MADLRIKIGSLEFRNPVILASGTCGYGAELDDFMDMAQLGGIIVKGTTLEPREGNAYPRMAETASGMLNAVGLQNKGIDYFEKNIYPHLAKYDTHVIVNVNGNTVEEYVELSSRIDRLDAIPAIELNISCPNVKKGRHDLRHQSRLSEGGDRRGPESLQQDLDSQAITQCHRCYRICTHLRGGGS